MNTTKTHVRATSMISEGNSSVRARGSRAFIALGTLVVLIAGAGTTTLQGAKAVSVRGPGSAVVVSPLNLQSWQVEHSHCNGGVSTGSQQFETGPATPPLGDGSYRFMIGADGDSLEALRYPGLDAIRIDQLTSLSYSTYVRDFNNGQAPYLLLDIDLDGDLKFDDQLFFEPMYQTAADFPPNPQGPPVEGQWQTWDAFNGGWWSANSICGADPGANVKSLAQYLSCQPNARIINSGNQGGFRIATGCGGDSYVPFDANIDNVTIGSSPLVGSPKSKPSGGVSLITFDFELTACTVTCPPDVIQDTDPAACGAIVNYTVPGITEGCGTITCTPGPGLFFPVGTTTVTCTNQQIILRPGQNTPQASSCLPNTMTESTSQTITPDNSFSCNDGSGNSETSYWRAFSLTNFSIANTFDVQSVDIGIQSATSGGARPDVVAKGSALSGTAPTGTPGQPVTLRLYTNSGGAFPGGVRNLIASGVYTIPDQALTIVNLPISAIVPSGSELVVEVFTPNGQGGRDKLFFIGSNAEVETGLSYVSAPDCNIADPTPTADIGFPDMHIVMNVNGCEEIATCTFNVTVRDTQPPSITCPDDITGTADPDQCSAVITYPGPTVTDDCPTGATVCAPASGSAFPIGITTVTCSVSDSFGNTASCSFTVTINDTQPPQITCPAVATAITDQNTCPSPACQVVNYPAPVAMDNCPGVVVVCNPPSGSCFPTGVAAVTCTATDASGNTASCMFSVTTFDVALQDDANPTTILLWNSITGQYRFCCNGITFTGIGKVKRQGCVYTLDQTGAADRRVVGRVDKSVHAGTGSIQAPAGTNRCTISDRSTLNDTNLTSCQ